MLKQDYTRLGLLILMFILMCGLLIQNCRQRKEITNKTVAPSIEPVKNGDGYVETTQHLYTEAEMNHITDSLRKALKVDKVTSVTKVVTKVDTVFTPEYHNFYIDTTHNLVYDYYTDKYVYLEFFGNMKTGYSKFKLQLAADTMSSIATVKKRLFKADEYNVKFTHTNPYYQTTDATAYTYKERKVLAVIGPSAGVNASYEEGKFKVVPYIGFGITFNLFSIKTK